jgi:hypothetical protein
MLLRASEFIINGGVSTISSALFCSNSLTHLSSFLFLCSQSYGKECNAVTA